jgi:hypothetical protein
MMSSRGGRGIYDVPGVESLLFTNVSAPDSGWGVELEALVLLWTNAREGDATSAADARFVGVCVGDLNCGS